MAVGRMELTPVGGEVWWVAPDPAVGREQSGRRPVLVISGEDYHQTVTTLIMAVPITTRDRGWANHVALEGPHGLDRESWAMTEQVRAISRERLVLRAGLVTNACLEAARRWVRDYLQ